MKTAVVTGGSSGIGLAVAERLKADGYHVATLDLNPSDAAPVLSQIADVTDRAQVDEALAAVRERLGPVTVLVNAAGTAGYKRFQDLTFAAWQRVVDVNLSSVFHCVQAVLPDMLESRLGAHRQHLLVQRAVRAAVHDALRRGQVGGQRPDQVARTRTGPGRITVNAVPPGFIDTPMLRKAESRELLGGTVEEHIQRTPVRRVGRPEDIAAACAFLVSEEAGYITGQILGVNGGRNT